MGDGYQRYWKAARRGGLIFFLAWCWFAGLIGILSPFASDPMGLERREWLVVTVIIAGSFVLGVLEFRRCLKK
jgi:hypothetical protein